ncbi:hypothetical protein CHINAEXTREME_01625 [Halobiforma lacisalsi AJ5]|uniref:Uncharacterized protein n=1 Tax=Natronobacterium lacisalsi AJ5 TaxID=358396 RepID=M0LJJ3_NATLA|nr:hypothetical protein CHINAEXTREME_01625 [Halobiforma lacisalsi AJ5]EMA32175.1 hypothetical protein C445_12711 [Halobiforma lacisalsi AJ5]
MTKCGSSAVDAVDRDVLEQRPPPLELRLEVPSFGFRERDRDGVDDGGDVAGRVVGVGVRSGRVVEQ